MSFEENTGDNCLGRSGCSFLC